MEKHTSNHTNHPSSHQTDEIGTFVKKNISSFQIIMVVLLLINAIFSGILVLRPSAQNMEEMKIGGAANFAKVMELYQSPEFQKNMLQNIETSLEQIKGGVEPTPTSNNPKAKSLNGKIESSQLQAIKKEAFIKGNPNAKITVIEYSDFQCPYCKKFHEDGTLEKLAQNYPQDVNLIFKSFVVHEGAQKASEALECIGSLKNTDAYYQAIAPIFNLSDMGIDSLSKIGNIVGISESKLKECITANTFTNKIEALKKEGSSLFGIKGTPGNVIINNESGEYVVIPGALPYASFEAAVKKILGK